MPRDHHFKAKYLLSAMAVQDIGKCFERFSPPQGQSYLQDLWGGLGLEVPADQRVDGEGLRVTPHEFKNGCPALVLTLPAPQERNEAYFLAMLQPQPGVGLVMALEHSWDPMHQVPSTALVGWSAQGRFNCGPGPAPDLPSFLAAVEAVLA